MLSKHTSVALVTHNNKLLLLLRDDKPEIPSPDRWSMIGGVGEENENPSETFVRETAEEINVKLDPNRLKLIYSMPSLLDEDRMIYLYQVELTDEEIQNIEKGEEGQELKFFTLAELDGLEDSKLTKHLKYLLNEKRDILQKYII